MKFEDGNFCAYLDRNSIWPIYAEKLLGLLRNFSTCYTSTEDVSQQCYYSYVRTKSICKHAQNNGQCPFKCRE